MNTLPDWRDVFCGREAELKQLISAYEAVTSGDGPRFAVVSAERGMGKTRLVQELYRHLTTKCDPDNYWPDASLFKGNNLRVAPDFNDDQTKEHFASFKTSERPMPFLWWGFRLIDSVGYNAGGSDMAGHRRTLDPHLERALFARAHAARLASVKGSALGTIKGAAVAVGEILLDAVPGVGAVKAAIEASIGLHKTAKSRADARSQADEFDEANLTRLEAQRAQDIYESTLDDLAQVLEASNDLTRVPAVVFCDDAQFARDGGDEGALRFLKQLWERAEKGQWPLLLVATHWAVDWDQDLKSENGSFGQTFRSIADDAELSTVVSLPKESDLSALILQGLPGLPRQDVDLLLVKADGNPQVLIELVDLIRTAPVWREKEGRLTPYARNEIEAKSCKLTELIAERLNDPKKTSHEVRIAVALSSLQGMQFLTTLTEETADALKCGTTEGGLSKAANPLRLIVGLDAGVASFVQRAYRDAAESIVGLALGKDPETVKAGVLETALAIIDDNKRWATLDAGMQRAMLGVMTSLAEDNPDAAVQLRAGRALIQLVELATDNAQRAEYAKQFQAGLASKKWPIDAFTFSQLDSVRSALGKWYGDGTTVELCELILDVTRDRQAAELHSVGRAETDLEAALLAASRAQHCRNAVNAAFLLREERVEIVRRRAKLQNTPESIDALCVALSELADSAAFSADYTNRELDLLREIVSLRRGTCAFQNPSNTTESLIKALLSLSERSSPSVALDLQWVIIDLRRKMASDCDGEVLRVDLALGLMELAKLLSVAGQALQSADIYSEALTVFREAREKFPTQDVTKKLAFALMTVAEEEADRGYFSEQRELLVEAAQAWSDLDDKCALQTVQELLAHNAVASGQWDLAREHCLQAEQLARQLGDVGEELGHLRKALLSKVPADVDWLTIDELAAEISAESEASRALQDQSLESLRQQFLNAGTRSVVCQDLAQALCDRAWELDARGLHEDGDAVAWECSEVSRCARAEGVSQQYVDAACFEILCGTWLSGQRSADRLDKVLVLAKELVNLRRVESLAVDDKSDLITALSMASEIAQSADDRISAADFLHEWLAVERCLVENSPESNRAGELMSPLEGLARLAKRSENWVTHDELQQERLKIGKQLWNAHGDSWGMLSAALSLMESARARGEKTGAVELGKLMVETVCALQTEQGAGWSDPDLVEMLAAAVRNMQGMSLESEKLDEALVMASSDFLSNCAEPSKLQNLAVSLRDAGMIGEAEQFQRKALEIMITRHGDNSLEAASCYSAMGMLCQLKNELRDARRFYKKALEIRERDLGPDAEATALIRRRIKDLHRA